MVASRM